MSYQVSAEQALESSGRLLKEGRFESVKLEGGVTVAEQIRRIVRAGIPVMGHVGLTPQSVHAFGGFKVQGRSEPGAQRILEDARAVCDAGAYAIVVEGVPSDLARQITSAVSVPTIGIGAGPDCDGQVLVCYDFLGMYQKLAPKFVKRYAELGAEVVAATQRYVAEVQRGEFPGPEHGFAGRERAARPEQPRPEEPSGGVPPYGPGTKEG
jgi:3-methyl-2-oxobutanoate hydroxymethyltransferase